MIEIETRSLYLSDSVLRRYEKIAAKFNELLFEKKGEKALEYLVNRGIDEESIKKFTIGWCPEDAPFTGSWENLKGRVIFPTKDEYGDIRCFSGRFPFSKGDLTESQKSKRWWNESFNKSFFFYGLDLALEHIFKKGYVILVEGQTDTIMCHKYGLQNSIGLMSGDFTPFHFAKISRITNNFVLMLDGDSAGIESAEKIQKEIQKRRVCGFSGKKGFNVINLCLQVKGKDYDPDEFLRRYGSSPIINRLIKKGLEGEQVDQESQKSIVR